MSATLSETFGNVELETRIQYGLMGLFGSLCLLAAVAPLELLTKSVIVAALFGLTAGIWISHLVQIVQKTAKQTDGEP